MNDNVGNVLANHLIAKTRPRAIDENIVFWKDYRITVLSDRLFRLEISESHIYRDEATQSVWFRDMPAQKFDFKQFKEKAIVDTGACKLILRQVRSDCSIELDGKRIRLDNKGNLYGTYRTLDNCDGDIYIDYQTHSRRKLILDTGVCSRSGVAIFDDADSLTLAGDGEVKAQKGDGSDEYIFAFGNDYRAAVRALYMITGQPPLIPRYALGNWWSRYHEYTDDEYLRVLDNFETRNVPLTVATVDMDWHYSQTQEIDDTFSIEERGLNKPEYVGDGGRGWTGYSWNKRLFPDYKGFLNDVNSRNLKITLNVHPADGVRFWENAYGEMAIANGIDPETLCRVHFDFTSVDYINSYFSVLHKPYESDGVEFWWIDWQQGMQSQIDGLDPLWSLNHYHYLDHASNHKIPMILSRYAGIGSHRYPVGFSGDTFITWDTLRYLPYFTATASNIGYTWWSHDIGGHQQGEKNDELYLRHIQYGVFSPINRLHGMDCDVITKEPWFYQNGTGLIAEEFLRLRHRLIPYLYNADYRTHTDGIALVEPLYYRHSEKEAYKHKNEYYLGDLLVAPVTDKCKSDGYARVDMWLPQGDWTDIFTGDRYEVQSGGAKSTLLRTLDSIPILARSGSILPLSADSGNSCDNPIKLDIYAYSGNGEYSLYEDGLSIGKDGAAFTDFVMREEKNVQILDITSRGDENIIPENRIITVYFKNIESGNVTLFIDDKPTQTGKIYSDCAYVRFAFDWKKHYRVEVKYNKKTRLQYLIERAQKVLAVAECDNNKKMDIYGQITNSKTIDEYIDVVDNSNIPTCVKLRLKEVV